MDTQLKALMNVRIVVLENMPLLKKLTLRAAFTHIEAGVADNVGELGKRKELKELKKLKELRRKVEISNNEEWKRVECYVDEIIIASGCCNKDELKLLDLRLFKYLRVLQVGDDCFENVNEVKLIGLHALESVVIGWNSFTKHKYKWGYDPNRHFYLKDCENLKELKIGRYSFNDFSVCEIANVPSLEVIEMGEWCEASYNFCYASLELKSDDDEMN